MRKGADVVSKWVGEAERQLRLLFEQAKRHQPSIIFFDEIDGLAPVRSIISLRYYIISLTRSSNQEDNFPTRNRYDPPNRIKYMLPLSLRFSL